MYDVVPTFSGIHATKHLLVEVHPITQPPTLIGNQLLGVLPSSVYERLLPYLELVSPAVGEALEPCGRCITYAHFPLDCVVSMMYEVDGNALEQAVIGNEGFVGTAVVLGGSSMPNRAILQTPGSVYRLEGGVLKTEFDRQLRLHDQLLLYAQALLIQVAQLSVCARYHSLEQRLCRWILQSVDRLPDAPQIRQLVVDLSRMRCSGAVKTAKQLHSRGVISYRHGQVTEADRRGLERLSCGCYGALTREYQRLLGRT